jgi:hypothetical protein
VGAISAGSFIMANGVAVLRPLAEDPAPALAPTDGEPIEQRIGIAMADAVAAISLGCVEWGWGGGLTVPTKSLGGERIAALYWLAQSSGPDFEATARTEGRRVLLERHGPDAHEATTNILIDGTLEILTKVSNFMRATAN